MLRLRPITKGTWRRIFKLYNSGAHPKYTDEVFSAAYVSILIRYVLLILQKYSAIFPVFLDAHKLTGKINC